MGTHSEQRVEVEVEGCRDSEGGLGDPRPAPGSLQSGTHHVTDTPEAALEGAGQRRGARQAEVEAVLVLGRSQLLLATHCTFTVGLKLSKHII